MPWWVVSECRSFWDLNFLSHFISVGKFFESHAPFGLEKPAQEVWSQRTLRSRNFTLGPDPDSRINITYNIAALYVTKRICRVEVGHFAYSMYGDSGADTLFP
jgi:hypothetical protein